VADELDGTILASFEALKFNPQVSRLKL